MTNGIFILLGGNQGSPEKVFADACLTIEEFDISIKASSSLYRSAAWGKTDQPDFLNQVLLIETDKGPKELLKVLLKIENLLGRKRIEKWGPRIIDIDILYYHQHVLILPDLKIPHPGIIERRFTLEPLAELAPGFVHPVNKKSQQELLALCDDPLPVKRID